MLDLVPVSTSSCQVSLIDINDACATPNFYRYISARPVFTASLFHIGQSKTWLTMALLVDIRFTDERRKIAIDSVDG